MNTELLKKYYVVRISEIEEKIKNCDIVIRNSKKELDVLADKIKELENKIEEYDNIKYDLKKIKWGMEDYLANN